MIKKHLVYGLLCVIGLNCVDVMSSDKGKQKKKQRTVRIEDDAPEIEEVPTNAFGTYILTTDDVQTLEEFEKAKKNASGQHKIHLESLEKKYFEKASEAAQARVDAANLNRYARSVHAEVEGIKKRTAEELAEAQRIANDAMIAKGSLKGQLIHNATVGAAQHFGGSFGTDVYHLAKVAALTAAVVAYEHMKPERVKQYEQELVQFKDLSDSIKRAKKEVGIVNNETYEDIEKNEKVLGLMENRFSKMDWLKECDYILQKDKKGRVTQRLVAKDFWEKEVNINGEMVLPNREEFVANGMVMPVYEFFVKEKQSLDLNSYQTMTAYFAQKEELQGQLAQMQKGAAYQQNKIQKMKRPAVLEEMKNSAKKTVENFSDDFTDAIKNEAAFVNAAARTVVASTVVTGIGVTAAGAVGCALYAVAETMVRGSLEALTA